MILSIPNPRDRPHYLVVRHGYAPRRAKGPLPAREKGPRPGSGGCASEAF